MPDHSKIHLVKGDITKLSVDAIVNAANKSLLGGGGVDGAIHRAAGPELLAECETLNGCATGDAKITGAYLLPARFVIHTVGPIWNEGRSREAEKLAACYRRSLELADENHLKTIAFPAISTGIYRFPIDLACRIALDTIFDYLEGTTGIEGVYLVCFDEAVYDTYVNML